MLKRPFTIGDRLYLTKEGVTGDVEDISMFYFMLKEVTNEESQTGKSVIVPNSAVFEGSIVNYSYDTPYIWQNIPVSVTYESDLKLAEKIVYEAALKVTGAEMKKGARIMKRMMPDSVHADLVRDKPVLRVEFADSNVNLNLRITCLPKQFRPFRTEV
jgi:small-conductance mechanosensitive channel